MTRSPPAMAINRNALVAFWFFMGVLPRQQDCTRFPASSLPPQLRGITSCIHCVSLNPGSWLADLRCHLWALYQPTLPSNWATNVRGSLSDNDCLAPLEKSPCAGLAPVRFEPIWKNIKPGFSSPMMNLLFE